MYSIGDKLVVRSGSRFGYPERVGNVGVVKTRDEDSVCLEFEYTVCGYKKCWFHNDEVSYVESVENLTMEKAVDFLKSLGYNVVLTK